MILFICITHSHILYLYIYIPICAPPPPQILFFSLLHYLLPIYHIHYVLLIIIFYDIERSGLHVGDQILEVNSVQFSSLASTSAVTVLTGSERLRVKVRRVGKVPAHKASKEKVAW